MRTGEAIGCQSSALGQHGREAVGYQQLVVGQRPTETCLESFRGELRVLRGEIRLVSISVHSRATRSFPLAAEAALNGLMRLSRGS